MGTGKSTVGRKVATLLKYQFIDSDLAIEKKENATVKDIFSEKGEPYFREQEKVFVEEGHPRSGCVVSCGGGLVVAEGMIERLKKIGVVVCLHASAESIFKRLEGDASRPLLNTANPASKIKELLDLRLPYYQKANVGIHTDGRSVQALANNVVRYYHQFI